jgi:hypothetical protein
MIELGGAMVGDGCRAEPFAEAQREALRAACAEDRDIWSIYANDFGPAGFDASIDLYVANPRNRTFLLYDGDELAGMSSSSASTRVGKSWRSAALFTARTCAAPASTAASRT